MRQLEQFLDAHAGVAGGPRRWPRPQKGQVFFESEVAAGAAWRAGVDDAGASETAAGGIGDDREAHQSLAVNLEALAATGGCGRGEKVFGAMVAPLGGGDQGGKERGELPDALVHTGGRPLLLFVLAEQVPALDGAGCRPRGPTSRVFQSPGPQIGVEGPHRGENGVGVLAQFADAVVAVADVAQPFLPGSGRSVGEMQRVDARLVQFQVSPEQQHQLARQLAQRGVVQGSLPFVEIVDE